MGLLKVLTSSLERVWTRFHDISLLWKQVGTSLINVIAVMLSKHIANSQTRSKKKSKEWKQLKNESWEKKRTISNYKKHFRPWRWFKFNFFVII